MRLLGACYLIYLAILCWRQATLDESLSVSIYKEGSHAKPKRYYVGLGLQSSLLNPKNWMFYSSLMLLLPHDALLWSKIFISVWMVIVVLGWNSLLILLLTYPKWIAVLQRRANMLYRLSAVCFLVFAGFLIVV
ncbi:LysE family transporter [Acinetobacter sp. MD2(2019)]|nr:LysE family transporter [Acinetobacter sp. MD2(2019)]